MPPAFWIPLTAKSLISLGSVHTALDAPEDTARWCVGGKTSAFLEELLLATRRLLLKHQHDVYWLYIRDLLSPSAAVASCVQQLPALTYTITVSSSSALLQFIYSRSRLLTFLGWGSNFLSTLSAFDLTFGLAFFKMSVIVISMV